MAKLKRKHKNAITKEKRIKIENGLLENTKEINEYDETYAYERKKKNNNMNKRTTKQNTNDKKMMRN